MMPVIVAMKRFCIQHLIYNTS